MALTLIMPKIYAQQTMAAAGGDATGSGGSISYTIGQVDYISANSAAGFINQGVQQPYEMFSVNMENFESNFNIIAFPNPATTTINVNIESLINGGLADIAVVDALGKVVIKQSTDRSSTEINLSNVSPGIYQLVVKTKTENKTIQFLKN
ncbi:MAG: T9SS type A sorting domain-containing protein [Bacteroidia bacterium]|nr:T9SS type A sorting domain-containing protein [Bacteroidia bacterium]